MSEFCVPNPQKVRIGGEGKGERVEKLVAAEGFNLVVYGQ